MKYLSIFLFLPVLSGCGLLGGKRDASPLVTSECPELSILRDDSFGATTEKLKEVADQYHLCRKAAIGVKQ